MLIRPSGRQRLGAPPVQLTGLLLTALRGVLSVVVADPEGYEFCLLRPR